MAAGNVDPFLGPIQVDWRGAMSPICTYAPDVLLVLVAGSPGSYLIHPVSSILHFFFFLFCTFEPSIVTRVVIGTYSKPRILAICRSS